MNRTCAPVFGARGGLGAAAPGFGAEPRSVQAAVGAMVTSRPTHGFELSNESLLAGVVVASLVEVVAAEVGVDLTG